jgi:hypothetical protein
LLSALLRFGGAPTSTSPSCRQTCPMHQDSLLDDPMRG